MAKAKKRKSKYEPDVPDTSIIQRTHKKHSHMVWSALHYAQYEMADKALKRALLIYAKKAELNHRALNVFNDKELAMLGKYAYIINGGGQLSETMETGFKNLLNETIARAKVAKAAKKAAAAEDDETVNTGPVLTVQDRMRIQAEELGAVFDQWIDDVMFGVVKNVTKEMDPSKVMAAAGFKAGQARWIRKMFRPEQKEIRAVLAGKDADLKEGYSNIKKATLTRVEKLLDSIVTAADMIGTVAKAQRKTRKKKAPSVQKRIAKLKYCERADDVGVASVSPAGIIAATEVWIYNTKYRKLGKYVAADASGLSVKGASITGYSDTLSVQKTLRKPKEQLKDFMAAGKVKLRTFLDDIKAVDTKLNGRMNENIVILKVFK